MLHVAPQELRCRERHQPLLVSGFWYTLNAMSLLCREKALVLECVDHATTRAACAHSRDLERGLSWLASIASTSFMLGLLATVAQMSSKTFVTCGGSWTSCYMPIGGRLAFALGFGAFGLLLSLISFCGYEYLTNQARNLRVEMETARLQLLNELSRFSQGDVGDRLTFSSRGTRWQRQNNVIVRPAQQSKPQ
jgi:biopolymer transport protein ExbB/TolQ